VGTEPSLGAELERAWLRRNPGSDLGSLAENLKNMEASLKSWSREKFGHVTREIERLRSVLEPLEGEDVIGNRAEILQAKIKLDELLYREEMMWLQRSRINWLKEGDRNTRYFHRKARWRAKKNKIRRLKRGDGSWCANQEEMKGMASHYFSDLFSKDSSLCPDDLTNLFAPKITMEMNWDLCKQYSEEEISNALFQIGPLKALGPDGFPARFFQRNLGADEGRHCHSCAGIL
jgi:hypothetical protein